MRLIKAFDMQRVKQRFLLEFYAQRHQFPVSMHRQFFVVVVIKLAFCLNGGEFWLVKRSNACCKGHSIGQLLEKYKFSLAEFCCWISSGIRALLQSYWSAWQAIAALTAKVPNHNPNKIFVRNMSQLFVVQYNVVNVNGKFVTIRRRNCTSIIQRSCCVLWHNYIWLSGGRSQSQNSRD